MPIYEYLCSRCSVPFEVLFIKSKEEEEVNVMCPKCGSTKTERVMSSPHIRMGKSALATTPDPEPPLQRQKKMGARDGFDGGFEDLEPMEEKNMIMNKDKDGNYIWREKERTTFSS
jgi:putative FmdB family regulatory protein